MHLEPQRQVSSPPHTIHRLKRQMNGVDFSMTHEIVLPCGRTRTTLPERTTIRSVPVCCATCRARNAARRIAFRDPFKSASAPDGISPSLGTGSFTCLGVVMACYSSPSIGARRPSCHKEPTGPPRVTDRKTPMQLKTATTRKPRQSSGCRGNKLTGLES